MDVGHPPRATVCMEWNQTNREVICATGYISGGMGLPKPLGAQRISSCAQMLERGAAGFEVLPAGFWSHFDHFFPYSGASTSEMRMFILCHSMLEVYNLFFIL